MRLGGKSTGNQKNWRLKFFNDDFTDWIPAGVGIENAITMHGTNRRASQHTPGPYWFQRSSLRL